MIISLPSLLATERFAARFAPYLKQGDVLAFEGDLGAGKTTFARALLQSMGVEGDIPSPTFTLVQPYDTPVGRVYHYDLYRLKKAEELEELAWDEARMDGIVLVEWPEKAGVYLPEETLTLIFSVSDQGMHSVEINALGPWKERLKGLS